LYITVAVGGHSESKVQYLHIEDAAGVPLKARYYTLKLLLEASLRVRYLHITIAVGASLKAWNFTI